MKTHYYVLITATIYYVLLYNLQVEKRKKKSNFLPFQKYFFQRTVSILNPESILYNFFHMPCFVFFVFLKIK